MIRYISVLGVLITSTFFASLPPHAKYIDVWVKDEKSAHYPSWQMYPLKQKYAVACPIIDANLKDHQIKFPQFNSPLFAMMVPCLKFNYKLNKESVPYAEQEKLKKDFKFWLQTCAEENLIDIIDVANTLDLPESRKLAATVLDKKIRTKLRKNVYYLEDIEYLKLRPLSFAKQFLPNLRKHKTTAKPKVDAPVSWLALLKKLFAKQDVSIPTQAPAIPKRSAINTTELFVNKPLSLKELFKISKKIDTEMAEKKSKLEQEYLANQSWISRLKRILWTVFFK